jgi:hypothetical protein
VLGPHAIRQRHVALPGERAGTKRRAEESIICRFVLILIIITTTTTTTIAIRSSSEERWAPTHLEFLGHLLKAGLEAGQVGVLELRGLFRTIEDKAHSKTQI